MRLSLEGLEERLTPSGFTFNNDTPGVFGQVNPNADPTTPTITTTPQPATATVGTSIADQASISGLVNANSSDTVTFNLYSSSTTQNSTTLLFSDTETITLGSDGTATATSKGFTPTTVGTDFWVATFNGDSNNNSISSGASDEPVTMTPTTPTITTTPQPATATVGSSIADQAAISGLVNANSSDTVTFNLYSSSSTQNSTTLLFSDTETVTLGSNGTATATSKGFPTTAPGSDFWVATFNGDSNNGSVSSGASAEPVTITPTTPTIATTQQPATATVGSSIADQASISGLVNANSSDTVTFNLYSSSTTQDSTTLLFTDTETVTLGSNGTATATSKGFPTTAPGSDFWVATFNGDSNNGSVSSGASAEPVTITPTTPTIATTQQPATATVGSSIADQASISGLVNANSSDTVTFNLYSSSTTQDSTTLLFTDTETVTLNGTTATATSKTFAPTTAGTDFWVATFNGDSNNGSVSTGAGDEPVTITPTTPTITTTPQPATATVGSSIADQASISGLVNANSSDTVTFKLFDNANGTGTALFTDTETVTLGSGGTTATATSKGFTTTASGSDFWVATFNGDSNNGSVSSGASAEPVTITPTTPTIATTQQPATATVGSSIADQASISGLVNANSSDTVTFNLYSSSSTQNSTTLLFTDTETVTLGSGGTTATATSKGFSTKATGTDFWVATFNGDSNNKTVSSGASAEPVTLTLTTPTIATTQQPTSASVGSSIADTATVSGLVNANSSDTVTFNLFDNANGTGTALFTDTETVTLGSNGTATATSKSFTPTTAGKDFWVATFNGDTNNAKVSSGVGDEPVTVSQFSTSVSLTKVNVVPSLTSQKAEVTLTALVSNATNLINEGVISFTMAGTTVQGNVVNGTATVQITIPLGQILSTPTVSIDYTDNAANPSFSDSNSSTKLYFNPWSVLLPSNVSFAANGTQLIQIQPGNQALLGFAYSILGMLTQINVGSTTYPVVYSHIANDVLVTIGGMPWQVNFFNASGQFLGLASVALNPDGSAEWLFFNAAGQVVGSTPI